VSTRPKRPRSAASRSSDRISHLHVVIDDTLRAKLEEHAVTAGWQLRVIRRELASLEDFFVQTTRVESSERASA
jgi:hypothetical protein